MIKYFLFFLKLFAAAFMLSAQDATDLEPLSLSNLRHYGFESSPLTITGLADDNTAFQAYNFVYTSMGLTVSGRLSLPKTAEIKGIIIMLRGYQPVRGYHTGKGTEYPARYYLRNGWAVAAPDFFGFGVSSPMPNSAEAHQLYSLVNTIELYKSLQQPVFRFASDAIRQSRSSWPAAFKKIGLWGHSNGGQLAVQFLEVTRLPLATVLWAPVTQPFPDSLLFYRSYTADWVAAFKRRYKVEDYSLLHFLSAIAPRTPLMLHQGGADESVPPLWSETFAKAVEAENRRRPSANAIQFTFYLYPDANHNLEPYWPAVLARDIAFWEASGVISP
jgi:dienelactone hydrolase